jgi:hypothetical protein
LAVRVARDARAVARSRRPRFFEVRPPARGRVDLGFARDSGVDFREALRDDFRGDERAPRFLAMILSG